MTRAVDERYRTARRPIREGLHPAADLVDVVAQRLAFWSPLAEDTRRSIETRHPDHPIFVRLSDADAATLVDVLLDNVFTHTPEGTSVLVTVEARDGSACLRVDDDGPGMSAPAVPVASGSTGMGLQIAARVAADARGQLSVGRADTLGGARVEVLLAGAARLPAAP